MIGFAVGPDWTFISVPTDSLYVTSFKSRFIKNSDGCSSDGMVCINTWQVCVLQFIMSLNERSQTTMLSYQTTASDLNSFMGRWKKNSLFGFKRCKYFSEEATGHHMPSVAYITPPSSASSSSLWFLVNSSRTFDTNLASVASVWTSKAAFLNCRRFWRPRLQKHSMISKNTLFRSVLVSSELKTPLLYSFFRSSSSIGGLCCTLAWPSFFSWTHWSVKTLLASLNSTSLIMSTLLLSV